MKKNFKIIFAIFSLLFLINPDFTYAKNNSKNVNVLNAESKAFDKVNKTDKNVNLNTNNVDKIKDKASNVIDRRTNQLQKLSEKVNNNSKLSLADKSQFLSQINKEIDDLKNLKSEIIAEEDLTALKSDVSQLQKKFKGTGLFVARMEVLLASDRLISTADKLSDFSKTLTDQINDAKGRGVDVTNLNNLLLDMQSKISDAKTKANNAKNLVFSLPVEPTSSNELKSARDTLKKGINDLKIARKDAKDINQGLKTNEVSPTSTITP